MSLVTVFPANSVTFAAISVVLLLIYVARWILLAFKPGLRGIPGPLSAKFTNFYRMKLIWGGGAHEKYRQMHQEYGLIVRSAPNVVDIADPKMIPIIYGINSKYYKVNLESGSKCRQVLIQGPV
jgi:hypothetical protein